MRRSTSLVLVLAGAGCVIGPGPRRRTGLVPAAPVAAELSAGGLVSFRADVVVWNPARERLAIQYGCGFPLWLEYEAGGRWRQAVRPVPFNCATVGMGTTLAEGDSVRVPLAYAGLRRAAPGDTAAGRWLGPLPGRYRLVVGTEGERRRWQHWRGGRDVRLVSRPFRLDAR